MIGKKIMTWCWWCCHPYESETLKLPVRYDNRRDVFSTCGQFCSWSCMKTYALETYGLTRGSIMCSNMILMRKKKFRKLSHIKPAPKRQTLKVFGGALDINEFRSNSIVDKVEDKLDINEKSENDVIVPIVSNTKKMYEIKSASGTNEQLRLKREKPLKRDQNNLESVLGLVIKPK